MPAEWARKWRVLDESFEFLVMALTREGGKSVGASVSEFVNQKFPFDEKSEFPIKA